MQRGGRLHLATRVRSPLFGRHGRKVVGLLCGYECVALVTPLPTISELVKRYPLLGVALLALLGHHWFLEVEALVVADEAEPNLNLAA